MKRRASSRIRRTGCGLLLVASTITCLLVLVNRVLVMSVYAAIVPSRFDYDRLRAVLQFLLMIALLLPEWWVIDRIAQLIRRSPGD